MTIPPSSAEVLVVRIRSNSDAPAGFTITLRGNDSSSDAATTTDRALWLFGEWLDRATTKVAVRTEDDGRGPGTVPR